MTKSILLPIHPEWCEKIFRGEKTIEVRKTKPKLQTPFKCYVYCTKGKKQLLLPTGEKLLECFNVVYQGNGKVIGEFVVDEIIEIPFENEYTKCYDISDDDLQLTCLTQEQLRKYGNGKKLYGWHITNAKLYDKPRELSEFNRYCDGVNDIRPCENGKECEYSVYDYQEGCEACAIDFDGTNCPYLKATRPPQSFCYVEEDKIDT